MMMPLLLRDLLLQLPRINGVHETVEDSGGNRLKKNWGGNLKGTEP
jgi:hypothetical protein